MKEEHKYIIVMIILFVILVAGICFSYVYIHYKDAGSIEIVKKYYDIYITDAKIDYESEMTIKINNDEKYVHVDIPNLKEKDIIEFSYDIKNIGNVDLVTEGYAITNLSTNTALNSVEFTTSLQKDTILRGGESKKVIIRIKNNDKNIKEIPYYNFNISYLFKELSL